jgi:plastocyanin
MKAKKNFRRLKATLLVAALIAVSGAVSTGNNVARAAGKASYTVLAGATSQIGIDNLAFSPQTLRVHRGDTITWNFSPIHDVHFAAKPVDLSIMSDIDGKQLPEINPVILTPSGQSGDTFKEGFNTGLIGDPGAPTSFAIVMDTAPGTYTYLCDLHAGMVGTIIVVADSETIPTPEDVAKEGQDGVNKVFAAAQTTALKAADAAVPVSTEPTLQISAGFTETTASINRYFPSVGVIKAGQTINWTVPAGLEPHTITFPLPDDGNIPPSLVPVVDKKNVPHLVFSDTMAPLNKSGESFKGTLSSGLIFPGQSFAATFPTAGIFKYFCAIHPGQIGTIVVLPADK